MRKRRDPESIIVQFFSEAPPEAVGILFRVVRGIIETRGLIGQRPNLAPVAPKETRRRKTPGGADLAVVADARD